MTTTGITLKEAKPSIMFGENGTAYIKWDEHYYSVTALNRTNHKKFSFSPDDADSVNVLKKLQLVVERTMEGKASKDVGSISIDTNNHVVETMKYSTTSSPDNSVDFKAIPIAQQAITEFGESLKGLKKTASPVAPKSKDSTSNPKTSQEENIVEFLEGRTPKANPQPQSSIQALVDQYAEKNGIDFNKARQEITKKIADFVEKQSQNAYPHIAGELAKILDKDPTLLKECIALTSIGTIFSTKITPDRFERAVNNGPIDPPIDENEKKLICKIYGAYIQKSNAVYSGPLIFNLFNATHADAPIVVVNKNIDSGEQTAKVYPNGANTAPKYALFLYSEEKKTATGESEIEYQSYSRSDAPKLNDLKNIPNTPTAAPAPKPAVKSLTSLKEFADCVTTEDSDRNKWRTELQEAYNNLPSDDQNKLHTAIFEMNGSDTFAGVIDNPDASFGGNFIQKVLFEADLKYFNAPGVIKLLQDAAKKLAKGKGKP